ncbi:Short chain dehydrogenase/reductase family 42E, member 1 [Balamuthia mandrillaris]
MENVIAACQENGVEKLIQTSSSAVLLDAKSLQHGGVDETTPYTKNPPGHYSRTKVLAEKAVLAANGKRGLSTIAIRPNGLFGPRDGIMTELVYINGELGPLLGYTNKQDWIYVENVVHGHLCAEEKLAPGSPVAGKAYCISPDRPMSYVEFWKEVVKYMHAAKTEDGSELVYVKPAVSYPLATIFEFVSWLTRGKLKAEALKLTPPVLRHARAEIYFNDSKARKELGYRPVYTMEESFRRLEEYYFPEGEEGESKKERQH